MKIALYIEDGLEQIVLTPETETEKGITSKLSDNTRELSVHRGGFYTCQGGWIRHANERHSDVPPESTIIVLREKKPT